MGQDLRYQAGGVIYEQRVTLADWELIESLRNHLPFEIDALFLVPELGQDVQVATSLLRSSVDNLLKFIGGNKYLLPFTYQFKQEVTGAFCAVPSFTTGGCGGIRLPGDDENFYVLSVRLNECRLDRNAVSPDGNGYLAFDRDLRGERELLTANLGKFVFRRTRAKTSLVKALPEIQRFLQKIAAPEIIKSVG